MNEQEYKGYTIKIEPDDMPENPRDWSNIGIMICDHQRYNLGDKDTDIKNRSDIWAKFGSNKEQREIIKHWLKGTTLEDFRYRYTQEFGDNWDEWITDLELDHAEKHAPDSIVLFDLYLYDHSGITIKTSPFSCPWDSGQVGIIYAEIEPFAKEHNLALDDAETKLREILESEVKIYDQYLTGDIWGYVILDDSDNEIASCWGFYGYDYCLESAKESIDHMNTVNKLIT